MPDTVDTLMLDLLQWMGPNPRRYNDVLDVWRTSCPRLPVWETAEDRGFIARRRQRFCQSLMKPLLRIRTSAKNPSCGISGDP